MEEFLKMSDAAPYYWNENTNRKERGSGSEGLVWLCTLPPLLSFKSLDMVPHILTSKNPVGIYFSLASSTHLVDLLCSSASRSRFQFKLLPFRKWYLLWNLGERTLTAFTLELFKASITLEIFYSFVRLRHDRSYPLEIKMIFYCLL